MTIPVVPLIPDLLSCINLSSANKTARFLGCIILSVAAVHGKTAGQPAAKQDVVVCVERAGDVPYAQWAEALASQLFQSINVRVSWRRQTSCGSVGDAVFVSYSTETPPELMPGSLAYAMPFERMRAVIFYDRITAHMNETFAARLLALVLTHEISHLIVGSNWHSEKGIMKPRYDKDDMSALRTKMLSFTAADVDLIRKGIISRTHRLAPDIARK